MGLVMSLLCCLSSIVKLQYTFLIILHSPLNTKGMVNII